MTHVHWPGAEPASRPLLFCIKGSVGYPPLKTRLRSWNASALVSSEFWDLRPEVPSAAFPKMIPRLVKKKVLAISALQRGRWHVRSLSCFGFAPSTEDKRPGRFRPCLTQTGAKPTRTFVLGTWSSWTTSSHRLGPALPLSIFRSGGNVSAVNF